MKKSILLIAMLVATTNVFSQENSQITNVGNNYDYKNFDKVNLIGFNDDIQVSVGKAFEVAIATKEENRKNLVFTYSEKEHELTIKLNNSSKKYSYKDRETYKIKISLPELSVFSNFGNGDVTINGVLGRYFKAKTAGNGDINCSGRIEQLDIEKIGNGDVNAKNLSAKNAKINSTGNGNVTVNVSGNLTAKNIGNGDIINYGNAKYDQDSKKVGNGKLLNQ